MAITDTAVGAILEIPSKTMAQIKRANDALLTLHESSRKAADQVYGDFARRMPDGVQKFIDKLAEAKKSMDGLGTINVTLNTGAAVTEGQKLSTQMQKTSSDVSKAAQEMSSVWNETLMGMKAPFGFSTIDISSVSAIKEQLKTLKGAWEDFGKTDSARAYMVNDVQLTRQQLADLIVYLEKGVAQWKQWSGEKEKALANIQQKQQSEKDKAYLDEQKRLLERILQLRKDISGISISVQRGTITGKTDMSADLAQLEQLRKELRETGWAYRDLRTFQSQTISEDAKIKAEIQSQNARNAGLRQEVDERNKLNAAITRANELTAQGQQGKSRLGSGEEASIQRQLNSDYKNQLAILKEIGEIKAKAAEQGKKLTINSAEVQLIQALAQRYRIYAEDVNRVAGAYRAMGEAAAKNFAADRSEQLARNAIMLADAQNKAAAAAQKVADAQAKAASQQAAKDRSQAESDLNRLYAERLRLLKEKEQLENKSMLGALQGKNAPLTQKENQLLTELTAKLQTVDSQIKTIAQTYAGLALKAKNAYALDELRQATQLQNQFNKAIDAIDASKAKQLTSEYKRLDAEYRKLNASLDQYNSKIAGNAPMGNPQAAIQAAHDIVNRMADVSTRMSEIERKNIQEVADFRLQKEMEANQKSISDFIQAEAQKKAAALQTAQEESNARKQALQAYLQSYQGAMQQADKIMSGRSGTSMFATNLENIKRAINDLKAASGNLNLLNPADVQKAEQLKRKIAELETLLKKYKDAATPDKPAISPQDAINAAKNATTLKQLEKAYKDLKDAMSGVDSSKPIWSQMNTQLGQTKKQIDDIKKKMGEFHSEVQKTSNIMGQLQSRIAAAFSVGAIMGFAKKVTEVRAQFELQRVALGAIIQDKDEANKVFLRVQQMALESPFSIMQLERSTKQIAAFGFEAKQLVPTMKMVADIGAGLGVELDRIVLVLGHLKARGYLEGTMVRQFTNMGFNVLGELAKYYTELEGRMVSVADVQDRVKKKMVEFGDVEEVLKRVTSAGGMFYDMQKKQSDSIWGQMQRITDAYDLMLNEIGKSNEGAIKTALTAIRSLINSWRTIAPMLKDIAYTMGGIFAIKGAIAMVWQLNKLGVMVQGLALGWRGVAAAASTAATSMKLAWSSTGIGLLVAGVLTAIEVVRGLNAEANALNEELGKIGEDNVKNLNDSIAQFVEFADVMSSSSKTYNERAEAMKDMKRVFSDILPMEKMEMDYIEGLNGNYTELIDTIAKYYQEKEYQQKYETIAESKEAQKSQRLIEETFERMNEDNKLGMIFSDSQIKAWADTLAAELNSGKLNNSIESIKKRVQEIFPDAKNIDSYFSEAYGKSDFTDVIDAVDKVRDAFGNISLSTADAANAMAMYNEQLGRMDFSQLDSEYEKIQQRIYETRLQINQIQNILNQGSTTDAEKAEYGAKLADLQIQLTNYTNALDSVEQAQGRVLAQGFYDEVDKDTKKLTDLVQTYWNLGIEMKDLLKSGIQPTDKAYKDLEAQQKKVRASADELKDSHAAVNWTLIDNANSTYELNGQLTQIASNAFPNVSKRVIEMSDNLQLAFAKSKKTLYGFMMALADILPDSWKSKLPDFAKSYNMAINEIAAIEGKLGEKTQDGNAALNERGKLYSDIATRNIEKYGAQTKRINEITKDSKKTSKDMAKDLRNEAKAWNEYVTAYEKSTNKESALKGMGLTEADIEQYRKNAKAAIAIADELWGEEKKGGKKGGHGKDPIKELWQNRMDAMKRYYDAAEKARKHLSESETATEQRGAMGDLWSSLGLNKIKGLSLDELIGKGFDPDKLRGDYVATLNELLKLIPEKYTDLRNKVQETIASESIEIKFKLKEDSEERLKKDIDKMFDNYELSKTFKDIGLNVDLTYMVGGKPTTLGDIRRELNETFLAEGGKKAAEERVKEYEDAFKRLDEIEHKNQIERIKNYSKYLLESMSERVQIELKAMQEIRKIRDDETLDQFSKDQAVMNRRKKMQEELTKFDFDQFKGSDVYISTFKDLEKASKEQLQYVIDKLKELQSVNKDLSPVQVKSIASDIRKAQDALGSRTSFKDIGKNLRDSVKYARNRNQLLKKQVNLQKQIAAQDKERSAAEIVLYDLTLKRDSIQDKNSEEWKNANAEVEKQQALVSALVSSVKKLKKEQADVTKEISKGEQAWINFQGGLGNISEKIGQVKEATDSIFEGLDSMGLVNDVFRDTYESISEIIGGVQTTISGLESIDITKPFSIITGVLKSIGGIFQTIGGFFGFGDKKKERDIKKQQESIESLDKAYQKLEKSIEKALTFDQYNAEFRKMNQNLEAQKAAYQEMIRLEEGKKKTDKEKIKEWQDQVDEINESLEEQRKKRYEIMGSISEDGYLDEATNFVSAWLDAYKETGDGLDALTEHWQEFYENLVMKQAASAIVSRRMAKYIDQINAAIDSGSTGLSLTHTFQQIGENLKSELGVWNEDLKAFFDALGIKGGTGEYELSDLQKGIQNITEPQAAAIEAYLNSMRFAVFRHTEQLDTLIQIVGAQYGVTTDNPVVNELKGIRIVLDSIDYKLSSVIDVSVGKSVIRVG